MHGLDVLLCRQSQVLILRTLYHAEERLTGREIERRTGLSNRATMLALENLVDASALYKKVDTHAHLYKINTNHYLVAKAIIPAFEVEDLFWTDLRKVIRRYVLPRPLATVATGPLTRDEMWSSGCLELTMLFSTGRNRLRAFNSMETLSETIWNRYALSIEPNLLDINTMNKESYETLWHRIEREGILLFGTLP